MLSFSLKNALFPFFHLLGGWLFTIMSKTPPKKDWHLQPKSPISKYLHLKCQKQKKTLHNPNFHSKNKGICEFWDFQILGLQKWDLKQKKVISNLLFYYVCVSMWMSLSLCLSLYGCLSLSASVCPPQSLLLGQ